MYATTIKTTWDDIFETVLLWQLCVHLNHSFTSSSLGKLPFQKYRKEKLHSREKLPFQKAQLVTKASVVFQISLNLTKNSSLEK